MYRKVWKHMDGSTVSVLLLRAADLLTYLNDTLIQRSSLLAERLSQRVYYNPEKTISKSNVLALVLCSQIFPCAQCYLYFKRLWGAKEYNSPSTEVKHLKRKMLSMFFPPMLIHVKTVIDLLQVMLLSTTVLFAFSASNSKWQLSEQNTA